MANVPAQGLFNPEPRETSDPSYTGASQKFEDNRGKALLGGIGDTLEVGAKGLTFALDQAIESDAYKLTDEKRKQIVGDITPEEAQSSALGRKVFHPSPGLFGPSVGAEGDPSEAYASADVPSGAQPGLQKASRLQDAFQQGVFSSSYYWQQMDSVASELRNRYPGQRAQIDSQLSKITGGIPANKLRESLLQDQTQIAAANSANNRAQDAFIKSKIGEISAVGGRVGENGELYLGNKPVTFARMLNLVGGFEARTKVTTQKLQELELNQKGTAIDEHTALKTVTGAAGDYTDNYLNNLGNQMGEGTWKGLQDKITEFQGKVARGETLDPQAVKVLQQQFNQTSAQLETGLRNAFYKKLPDGKTTWAQLLGGDKAKIDSVVESQMARIKEQHDLIQSDKWGLVGLNAAMASNTISASERKLLLSSNEALQAATVSKILGPAGATALDKILFQGGEKAGLVPLVEAVRGITLVNIMSGKTTVPDAIGRVGTHYDFTPQQQASTAKNIVDKSVGLLTLPETPEDQRLAVANSMYGPNAKSTLVEFTNATSQGYVFNKIYSPEVSAKIAEMAKKSPTVAKNYATQGDNEFRQLYRQSLDELKEARTSTGGVAKGVYNPETGSLELQFAKNPGDFAKSLFYPVAGNLKDAQEATTRLNTALGNLRTVYETVSASKPIAKALMEEYLGRVGIEVKQPPAPAKKGF